MSYIRAFIAIPLPDSIKTYLGHVQNQLKARNLFKASWSKSASMHLTLKFLGNINTGDIKTIQKCIETAVSNIPQFTLAASSVGVFPSTKKARVIWSGIKDNTGILNSLVQGIEYQLFEQLDIPSGKKKFSPHLTLARLKQSVEPKKMNYLINEYKDKVSDEFIVSNIYFLQSELKSSGAIHKIIFISKFKS